MKKQSVPVSPLTAALSGSAKEVELRIRNIFQWKKKRPPLWAMLLTALAILSCGSLVSCQGREAEEEPPAPAVEEPPAPNVEEPPARTVEELAQRLQYDPDDSFQAFLVGRDLDGAGDHDDAVCAVSEHSEEIPYSEDVYKRQPHTPPLVRAPVNSFEFQPCDRTPQVGYLLC